MQGSAELAEADLTHLLSVGQLPNVDATGTVRLTARFFGTSADPRGEADVTLSRGLILQQPYDAITAHVQYLGPAAQALTATFASGPKRVNLTARRTGAPDTFPKGRTAFEISSNTMALSQIALVRERQPDIAGTLEFKASGAVVIGPRWHLESLDATGGTTGIALAGRNLGNSRFTLRGINDVVEARFDSDAAGASIHGEGTVALRDDYPLTATISLADVDLKALEMLTERAGSRSARARQFEGSLRGEVSLRGPLANFEQATGTLDIPQFELRPAKGSPLLRSVPDFALRSSGPLRATLAQSTIRLEAARFEAPATDLTVDGAIQLSRRSPQSEPVQLNLRIRGTANMALARNFIPDLTSSGSIVLDATLRGSPGAPLLSGRANIRGGDFRYAGFSNGLTSVAGEVVFNGARATIQSLTGETGGGKVEATGFAAITGDTVAFRMDGRASGVRVRYPEGVSSVSDVTLTVAGTSERSEASGIVTIHRLAVNPRADLAAIIASAAERQPALADTGLMANMNLDIQVATAPDIAFETNVAQGIQADASLRLRGTAANPALLGRINVSHGELMFFGNKYTISQGAVSFYNPARIEPVLNLDLTTRARGVDVVLTVAGPADRLNMSYRSDPPLEFSDIINLLATGRAPGNQTAASRSNGPASGFEQLGAAALLGEALTNPVAGRLQRFFGVSRLKIDPQLTGVTGSPQARLTIEQQVTPDILFTYITDLAGTNNQLVRVEWSINSQVSAVLGREENGFVGVDFVWKKRFK